MSNSDSAASFTAPLVEELDPLFPKYGITELIATGGTGAVYRALQTALAREVAIKILPKRSGHDAGFDAGFQAEAKAMARLNHPNLIGVYDFGEVGGMPFIVMEFVPGPSLHDACHGSAVEPSEAIRLVSAVARGLSHAHEHGILHRDLTPSNILLDAKLQPKLGGFDLARPAEGGVRAGEGTFGTPGYTAPEVLEPPHETDYRSDIFSLGVLLHELLTGQLPEADPRPPSGICHCDPRLDAVVGKAAHPDPLLRYLDAEEVADELEAVAHRSGPRLLQPREAATAGGPPVAARGPARPARKSRGGLLVALVIVIATAVGVHLFRKHDADGEGLAPIAAHPAPGGMVADPVAPGPAAREDPHPPADPGEEAATVPGPGPLGAREGPPGSGTPPDSGEAPSREESGEDGTSTRLSAVDGAGDSGKEVRGEPAAAPEPKFDVDAFLEHARSVMLDRCRPTLEQRDGLLENNVNNFKHEVQNEIPVQLKKIWWEAADRDLREDIDNMVRNGYRMHGMLTSGLRRKKWAKELLEEHRTKEKAIDERTMEDLRREARTYLRGLELRVPKLRKENDPVAADMIEDEIGTVRADPGYFPGLMLKAYGP